MVVFLQLQLFMRHFSNSCTSSLKKQIKESKMKMEQRVDLDSKRAVAQHTLSQTYGKITILYISTIINFAAGKNYI